jgi:hypothetical protein
MTPAELQTLGPYFRPGERYLNGTPVEWTSIHYETMFWLKVLREHLDAPIHLIRGAHPHQPTAIDACCPSVPLAQVFLALTRVPRCSWGIYSGASFHVDCREFRFLPSRWLAVKLEEERLLKEFGLGELETARKGGWIYLSFNHPKALDAVNLVCRLADGKRTAPAAV